MQLMISALWCSLQLRAAEREGGSLWSSLPVTGVKQFGLGGKICFCSDLYLVIIDKLFPDLTLVWAKSDPTSYTCTHQHEYPSSLHLYAVLWYQLDSLKMLKGMGGPPNYKNTNECTKFMCFQTFEFAVQYFRGRPLMIWGGRRKNRKWIYFFRRNAFLELFEIYFFLGKAFRDLFFPGEGPPRFFFSRFPPAPPPRSLMVVPLIIILDFGMEEIILCRHFVHISTVKL